MKEKLCCVVLAIAFFLFPAASFCQWVQTNGPYGGTIDCFAVSGTNLYAGTYYGGVLLPTDNGTTWTIYILSTKWYFVPTTPNSSCRRGRCLPA